MKRMRKQLAICTGALLAGALLTAALLAAATSARARQFAMLAQTDVQASPAASQVSLTLDTAQSTLHWTLDSTLHTVHGTFLVKRGSVQFDPQSGAASGEIVVAATSGDSGNDSRDKKMHQEILESAKFPDIIFRPDHIVGKVPGSGSWTAGLHGVFLLHGAEHEFTVPVQGEFTGDHWKGTAKFSVPYIQWGLKNPSNFLLKVNPAVDVELDMSGATQTLGAK
jgi:polyisoprenoid-binding protein YceI